MPANMIINTASVVGYNNKLKQAVPGTKLGVNNELNTDTKKSALKLMEGGPSKINPPKQPSFKPGPQSSNSRSRPAASQKAHTLYFAFRRGGANQGSLQRATKQNRAARNK